MDLNPRAATVLIKGDDDLLKYGINACTKKNSMGEIWAAVIGLYCGTKKRIQKGKEKKE